MREIKFKAKREDNGEWIYGFYWTNLLGNHFIRRVQDENNGKFFILEDVEIDERTLCQYTELKDKNGTEIYEHDKMSYEYYEEYGTIEWDKNTAMFVVSFDGWCTDFDHINEKDLEVVGSKFDEEE